MSRPILYTSLNVGCVTVLSGAMVWHVIRTFQADNLLVASAQVVLIALLVAGVVWAYVHRRWRPSKLLPRMVFWCYVWGVVSVGLIGHYLEMASAIFGGLILIPLTLADARIDSLFRYRPGVDSALDPQ